MRTKLVKDSLKDRLPIIGEVNGKPVIIDEKDVDYQREVNVRITRQRCGGGHRILRKKIGGD